MSTETSTQIDAYKAVTVNIKVKSVLRLLQGEDPDKVASELGVATERLSRWKERFMQGGRASLLRRRTDETLRLQRRRQKVVQWMLLVLGLIFAIWLITRVFAGMLQSSA